MSDRDSARQAITRPPETLISRYTPDDLAVFDDEEYRRFLEPFGETVDAALQGDADAWRRIGPAVTWELLYRREPELWERLVAGERIHPDVLAWIPGAASAVELGAGGGRLTTEIADRYDRFIAIEPVRALREILDAKLRERGINAVEIVRGFFDEIPLPDDTAELVVSCSSFTSDPASGGDPGLDEMTRVLRPGGMIALVWPTDIDWLRSRGFAYEAFGGEMAIDFGSLEDALELAGIAYPWAVDAIRAAGSGRVPYELIGMNPPRDVAWKRVT